MLHRNAGRATVYHFDADDWVWSGRAQCGYDIRTPSHNAVDQAEAERSGRRICRLCLRVLAAREVKSLPGGRLVRGLRSSDRTLNTTESPEGPCPDCEGRGYVPDEAGAVQACGECQACPDDDEAAGRLSAGLLRGDRYARRVQAALVDDTAGDDEPPPACPHCEAPLGGTFLGQLGDKAWARCRACGADFEV